jgi:hypothetical protein
MIQILGMLPPPVMIVLIGLAVFFVMWLILKFKKSEGIEKLGDELFKSTVKDTIDEAITSIKDGKEVLVQKTKENVDKIAEIAKDQLKIDDNK